MNEQEIFYLLALQKVKRVGDISAKKLLKHFGSAKAVFEAVKDKNLQVADIGTFKLQAINEFNDWERVTHEIKFIEENNLEVVTIFDDNYPDRLFHAPDGPIMYFQKGNFNIKQSKIISIVGTRNITPYGKRMVEDIVEGLKEHNPLIISGLAYGVDVEAHLNAVKHNLTTVGVLGHGFNRIYPSMHKKIAEKMLANGGLISEFWSSDIVDRNNFLKRNRIVAGLSEATIIIESGEKGGSLVTADIANSYNRDVFAVPGRSTDKFSLGCNNLIKRNQAALITSAQDIIDFLQWETKEKTNKNVQLNLFVDLNPEEQRIFDFLQENGKTTLDEIAFSLEMPISKTAQILLGLELQNVITSLAGKQYEIL
jgi:DNA processing protein